MHYPPVNEHRPCQTGVGRLVKLRKKGNIFRVELSIYQRVTTVAILVVGLEHFLFSIIYGIILPIDYYYSRWLKPTTSNS